MLFWALILSFYSRSRSGTNRDEQSRADAVRRPARSPRCSLFFLATTALQGESLRAARLGCRSTAAGLNPQLQNPGMAIHPPTLYLGYVATTIPFAFAIAALVTRRLDAEWLAAVRRWALVSWFFLTIGIMLGMWWAYVELGWGGYWAWDPVENASLLPWLTGTAFLHSIMIQEKRGHAAQVERHARRRDVPARRSSARSSRAAASSRACTRSRSRRSAPGSPTFLVVATAVTVYLVATRLKDLEAKAELESMVSREAAFLYNNLLLVGIAFSVLWGTLFPIISASGCAATKITVGPPFFNAVNVPLGLLLLALTGIGPLIAWRKASVVEPAAAVRGARRSPASSFGGAAVRARACATGTRSSRMLLAASSPARSCRSSRRASARAGRFTASRFTRRSCGSSRAIGAATAATSCTPAS